MALAFDAAKLQIKIDTAKKSSGAENKLFFLHLQLRHAGGELGYAQLEKVVAVLAVAEAVTK